jgi:hypothetical protein
VFWPISEWAEEEKEGSVMALVTSLKSQDCFLFSCALLEIADDGIF